MVKDMQFQLCVDVVQASHHFPPPHHVLGCLSKSYWPQIDVVDVNGIQKLCELCSRTAQAQQLPSFGISFSKCKECGECHRPRRNDGVVVSAIERRVPSFQPMRGKHSDADVPTDLRCSKIQTFHYCLDYWFSDSLEPQKLDEFQKNAMQIVKRKILVRIKSWDVA
ncbi:hypothetical protein K470DRAFT_160156 [Piedraia hortae CBS 480.64]|uniref:Uncharacterized protein n=1 Tax=Piedraia hortae CBS 480.64 TaxID=1314780 RepID=A0A6A7BR65_9PEZI|nr:hypothetical protein K470DRAFT_160156 [Piedraia hortae CBS 480.64]